MPNNSHVARFKRGDILYKARPGIIHPVPSKIVLEVVGKNYTLCNAIDPYLKIDGMDSKRLAKTSVAITVVESQYKRMGVHKEEPKEEPKEVEETSKEVEENVENEESEDTEIDE